MALGKNLKKFRNEAGLSQEALSELTGGAVSQGAISNLENRDSESSKFTSMLATALGITLNELISGKRLVIDEHSNAEPAPSLGELRKIGVVGTAQLGDDGYWSELEYPVGHGDGYVQHSSRDRNAYALRCRGDSMKPRIKNGEFVIIEPGHQPINGDEVMVKCKRGRVMVKELLYIRDETLHLGSVNEAHGKITIPMQEVEAVQYVAAIVKSSYWIPE